jgi:hypothetical protein
MNLEALRSETDLCKAHVKRYEHSYCIWHLYTVLFTLWPDYASLKHGDLNMELIIPTIPALGFYISTASSVVF